MNFAGKFGSGAADTFSSVALYSDSPAHRGGSDAVTIPDAHLLFSGDYSRSGTDLIVSDQFHRVVVPNYFHGDKRPMLVSPEGAPLDPGVIEALTGHVQYAQASGAAAAGKVVGHVVKMTGSASVVRNGVTVTLNEGDNVYQSDVVQTGSGSTLGLVLIDGTTFNLSASARLMLSDLTYEAGSTSNSALFTLVQGAASFVAGQVAKTGDMKVGTPVATMGIRGTAVILDISAVDGRVSISVVDQRDGQVHAVQVFNTQGVLIGTVTSNGSALTLTPVANFEVIAQESNKTVAQVALEFNTFQTLLQTYDVGRQLFPNLPEHTDNANPQQPTRFAGSQIQPADSTSTQFNAPVGANTGSLLPAGPGTPVQVVINSGSGPTGSSTAPADPIVVQVVVPATPLPFVVTPPTVSRISGDGGDHFGPVMSADGQSIVYDPDGSIFLYDRQSNTTITIAQAGNGFTYSGQTISADGRYIVFQGSDGTQSYVFIYNNDPSDSAHYQHTIQLVEGGAPAVSGDGSIIVVEHGGNSIGVYDQQGHVLATITPAAIGETGSVWLPAISANGHLIAFWSTGASTPGGSGHLLTYDLSTGTVTDIASTATDAGNSAASLSADGRYIVYQSDAPGGHSEIYLYDLSTGQVVFHTANASGASYNPVISPDGHFIIFASDAHLTSGDTNAVADTYVVDVSDPGNPVYRLVSSLADGTQSDAASNLGAAISVGGLFVAFGSSASNLSQGDTPGTGDIFLADATSGHSAIIRETANSPPILEASGIITLTGDHNGVTLGVSDPTGRFTAEFDADGNIVWHFSEPRSDFASLLPGQLAIQNFTVTLSNSVGTTTIPVRVSVYDADQPVAAVVANPGTIAGDNDGNTLTGTAGNDILQGFGGDDTIIGLTGLDRAVYTDATGGITVDMAAWTVSGQGVGTDTLTDIEAIQGSNFIDHYSAVGFTGISGVPGVPIGLNTFEGMAGDDFIIGNVNVQGQALTRISYASATAAVTVDFAAGTAIGNASVGSDHFTNVSGVIGSSFGDTLRGSDNINGSYESFEGRGGNDIIDGRGGYDLAVYSNDPATTLGITVNLAAGTVIGDASIGTDTLDSVEAVRGTQFADTYDARHFGSAGFLNPATGNVGSYGTFNNFDGQGGNDLIYGNGNTRIQYSQSTAAVTVDIELGTAHGTASGDLANTGTDTFSGVNAVMGSMFGDTLLGSANNESFLGLAGDDFIDGRGGFDTAQYGILTFTTGGVSVDLVHGIVAGDASTGTDTLRSIEGVQGTNFNDTFDATNFGAAGYLDPLLFNVGNNGTYNQFEGWDGDDQITGNGNTTILYVNAGAGVTVDLAAGTAHGTASGDLANIGQDTITGGVNSVVGSNFGDVLLGSDNAPGTIEQFNGLGGNDTLDGRGGTDRLIGGGGADTFVYAAGYGADTIADFHHSDGDRIDLTGVPGIHSLADVLAHATPSGVDTFIDFGGGNSLTLSNVSLASLVADDFVFNELATSTLTSTAGVSIVVTPDGATNGFVFPGAGNVTTPGTPEDRIVLGYDIGASHVVLNSDPMLGVHDFTPISSVFHSFDGGSSVVTRLDAGNDVTLTQTIELGTDANFFTTTIDIDNGGTLDLTGVRFMRSFDPDQDLQPFGTFFTFNDVAQNPDGSASFAIVSAIGPTSGVHAALVGLGGQWRGSVFGFTNTDPYVPGAFDTPVDPNGALDDLAISLTNDIGTVVAGSHVQITYFTTANVATDGSNALYGAAGNDTVDGLGGDDLLIGLGGADTFVFSPGAGHDTIYDFTPGADRIQLDHFSGVPLSVNGVFTEADLDAWRATPGVFETQGNDTLIHLSPDDTLLLKNVAAADLHAADFIVVANQAPTVDGDMAIAVVRGSSVALTTADVKADDLDGDPASLTFTVVESSHGHLFNAESGDTIAPGDHFTLGDIQANWILFVTDDPDYAGAGAVTLTLSDGASPDRTVFVGASIVDAQFTVLTADGYDFDQDDPIGAMGRGDVVPDSADPAHSFTIVNGQANRDFLVTGSGFVYNPELHRFTAGTITFIQEVTHDPSHTPLATFSLHVPAADWYNAVVAQSHGDQGPIEALVSQWTFSFVGNGGGDAFFAGDVNDIFTGRSGNDTLGGEFGYDRANYGGATGPINVQLAAGTVTGDGSVGADTLQSIEFVTGSNFADTFNATGFSASSTNAGSTVAFNVGGTFNEFEGRGGNDTIIGNGDTRISYYHATSGVTVTFDGWISGQGASGHASGDSSVGTDTFTGVSRVRGSFFDDTFFGSDNPFGTNENFEGLGGHDVTHGGVGFDRAIYRGAFVGTGITVDLAAGTVTGGSDVGSDLLDSVEGITGTDFADVYNAVGFSTSSANAGNTQVSATNATATDFNEFEGAGGDDTVIGNGNTRIAFYNATGGVVVTLGDNTDPNASTNHGSAVGASSGVDDIVSGVTRVRGSEFNDIITGNSANNTLEGRAGNDVLDGRAGDDVLIGGTGADIFVYEANGGHDRITDFNRAQGDRIDLRLAGISGIGTGSGLATLTTGAFNPSNGEFTAGAGSDTRITGFGSGNSIIVQGMVGSQASDFIFTGQVAVTVQTPDGYDFSTLYDDLAASNAAQLANDDTHIFAVNTARGITFELIGTGLASSGGGTVTAINILNTTDPAQTTQDHVLVNTNGWNIQAIDLFAAIGEYNSPVTREAGIADLNAIFNSVSYSAVGTGGFADNHSQPHDGADVFFGGNQADVFNGMPGPFGPFDPGSDTVDYSHATAPVSVNLFDGTTSGAAAAGDIFISIENLRGSDFNDVLTGDGQNNVIEGGLGNDTLDGGASGYGVDTASYEHATAAVSVSLAFVGAQNTGAAGTDTLINIEGLRGSDFNDTLTGNGGSVLEGGLGDDHLIGHGGETGDTASYAHASSGVTVDLSTPNPQNTGGAGIDTLTNIANLTGSQFNDTLTGDTHDNTFFGNGGNDTFVFNDTALGGIGNDTIGDFMSGQDHIQLDYAAFDSSGSNDFSAWVAAGHVIIDGNDVLIDLHLNGQNTIRLQNASFGGLHANDFILPAGGGA
ncbi:FecR domain-containing protein [Bradyrhizobium sediminis]|uniref:FecR domain-containing protein n=1 Tax=Bradyrhizobium sediminis TaxID=2840469 RepID=A0A975NNB7_9BRAD|nr:cadherin-like domain-containing protein [Bradyrhizobium sediminis]QWG18005.1 FecR domain-containing protein [Bradyrhizobium sediminis]